MKETQTIVPDAIDKALADEINELHSQVTAEVTKVRAHGGRSLMLAVQCGEMLTEAKDKVGHGQFLSWMRHHCPQISRTTSERYRRLARSKRVRDLVRKMLANASTVTHLDPSTMVEGYRAVGVLPGPSEESTALIEAYRATGVVADPGERRAAAQGIAGRPGPASYIDRILLLFHRQAKERPISQWTPEVRQVWRAALEPAVKLYAELS